MPDAVEALMPWVGGLQTPAYILELHTGQRRGMTILYAGARRGAFSAIVPRACRGTSA